jgi:hypothetical protein
MKKQKLKLSDDGKMAFRDKDHAYFLLDKEQKFISVTTFIGTFFDKFDADKMAKIKAFLSAKKGIKGQGVAYWKKKWKGAAVHGSRVHSLLQCKLDPSAKPMKATYTDVDKAKAEHGYSALMEVFGSNIPNIMCEKIIYDETLGLAGQIDMLYESGEEINLIDYKTNDSITKVGYKGKRAKYPIDHLDDCSFSKYSLQLNIYAAMLKRQGKKVGKMHIVHLREDGYELMEVPDMTKEVTKLFELLEV